MRRIKLTRGEREIEDALIKGKTVPVSKEEFEKLAKAIADYRKDAVLNIRINNNDLSLLKEKAHKLGVKYQTFICEILHRVAHS